jgi:DNA-directed RNA polymerase specialized sigma24 family protein
MNDANAPADKELSALHFEGLLRRLAHDRNSAGLEYEKLRLKLIKFFQWNGCVPAEDLVDETLDTVAQKLHEEDINNLLAFARAVAHKIKQDSYKRMYRMVSLSDLTHTDQPPINRQHFEDEVHERMDNARRRKCFVRCVNRLPDEDRILFLAYYDPKMKDALARQKLAAKFGTTIGGIRVRINRIRCKLEGCSRRCLALH